MAHRHHSCNFMNRSVALQSVTASRAAHICLFRISAPNRRGLGRPLWTGVRASSMTRFRFIFICFAPRGSRVFQVWYVLIRLEVFLRTE